MDYDWEFATDLPIILLFVVLFHIKEIKLLVSNIKVLGMSSLLF